MSDTKNNISIGRKHLGLSVSRLKKTLVFKALTAVVAISFFFTNINLSDAIALQPPLSRSYAPFDLNWQTLIAIRTTKAMKGFMLTALIDEYGSMETVSIDDVASLAKFLWEGKEERDAGAIKDIYIKDGKEIRDFGLELNDFKVIKDATGAITEILIEMDVKDVEGGNVTLRYFDPNSPTNLSGENYVPASMWQIDEKYQGGKLAVELLYSKPLQEALVANAKKEDFAQVEKVLVEKMEDVLSEILPQAEKKEEESEDSDKIETSGLKRAIYYASGIGVIIAGAFLLGYISQDWAGFLIMLSTIHSLMDFHTYRAIKNIVGDGKVPIAKYDINTKRILYLKKNWRGCEVSQRYTKDEDASIISRLDGLSRAVVKLHEFIHSFGIRSEKVAYTLTPFIILPYQISRILSLEANKKHRLAFERLEPRLALNGVGVDTNTLPFMAGPVDDISAVYAPLEVVINEEVAAEMAPYVEHDADGKIVAEEESFYGGITAPEAAVVSEPIEILAEQETPVLSHAPMGITVTSAPTYTYYDSGRIESKTFSTPDPDGNIYYHYIDEDFGGQGYGRIDVAIRLTPDVEGGKAYDFTYFYGTDKVLYKDVYQEGNYADLSNPTFSEILIRYEYDTSGDVVFKVYRTPTKIYKDGILVEEYGFSGPTVDTGYHIYYLEYHLNGKVKAQTKYYLEGMTNIYSEFDASGNLIMQQIRYGTLDDYIIIDTIYFGSGGGSDYDWALGFYVSAEYGNTTWERPPSYMRNGMTEIVTNASHLWGVTIVIVVTDPFTGEKFYHSITYIAPKTYGGSTFFSSEPLQLEKYPWNQRSRVFEHYYGTYEWAINEGEEGEGYEYDWVRPDGEEEIYIEIYDKEGKLIERTKVEIGQEGDKKEGEKIPAEQKKGEKAPAEQELEKTEKQEEEHPAEKIEAPLTEEEAAVDILMKGEEEWLPDGALEKLEGKEGNFKGDATAVKSKNPDDMSALNILEIVALGAAVTTLTGAALLDKGRKPKDFEQSVKARIKENLDAFGGFSREDAKPILIKVPLELLENAQDDSVKEWLVALAGANKLVELYRIAADPENPHKEIYEKVKDETYAAYGLPAPSQLARIEASRENVISLLTVARGQDEKTLKRQLQKRVDDISDFTNSVIVPLGKEDDPTGALRAIVLGLGVVRMLRSPEDREEIQEETAKLYYTFIKTYGDENKYHPEDLRMYITTFISGEYDLNDVINGLMALIRSLPSAERIPIDVYNFATQLVRQAA